jgi:hypothetical protein
MIAARYAAARAERRHDCKEQLQFVAARDLVVTLTLIGCREICVRASYL